MKNCIILGSGRSGTSMIAGTLSEAGYFMGDSLLPPTEGNPKGYFESREVEAVNDALVQTMLPPSKWEQRLASLRLRPLPQQPDFDALEGWVKARWLALIPPNRKPQLKPIYRGQIETLVAHAPFCFKDPRFSYTLPAWRPFLQNTAFICVFREPAITAASILKEIEGESYLRGITMSFAQVIDLWTLVYRHILEKHRHEGDWLFLHYNQVLTPEGLDRVEALLETRVKRDFPDVNLQRTQSQQPVVRTAEGAYHQLCALAGYNKS